MLHDGDTQILASPRIRVRNREKAKIMIGDRVPVITNSVTPLATGAAVTTGSIQYLDVGLKLEVEPDIHLDNEVVIKLGLEVSTLKGDPINTASGTVAYNVGTRSANTVLRLKDGETQILGGLINDSDIKSSVKIPGLGQVPILGWLFSDHTRNKAKTEIMLSITPHVVGSASLPDASNEKYWSGTESSVRDGLLNVNSKGSISVTTSDTVSPYVRPRPMAPSHIGIPPASQSSAAATPVVLSWQGPAQVKQGETFDLILNAQSQQPVGSMGLQVRFDPSVFKAVDVAAGSFLKQGNVEPSLDKTIDPASGQAQLVLSRAGTSGASGTGSLATMKFEAIAAHPQSPIVVEQMAAKGPGGMALPSTGPNPQFVEVVQ